MNKVNLVNTIKYVTHSKASGLRSMQNINGPEREIIEAYRSELPHEIWGDAEKLKEWVIKKFKELTNKNYSSIMLNERVVERDRNGTVKAWASILDEDAICKQNPFLKLKILRSVTEDLAENNMQLAPMIYPKFVADAIYIAKKTGASFRKTYFKLIREFDNSLNVKTEVIDENEVRGKWFSLKVPDWSEAEYCPGKFSKIKEFVSVLSQGSNWCTRTPSAVGRDFMGCDFHIFIDSKGYPQICMVGSDKAGGNYKFVRGNDQYTKIPEKFRKVLKSFLEKHNLDDAQVGTSDEKSIHILDLCE